MHHEECRLFLCPHSNNNLDIFGTYWHLLALNPLGVGGDLKFIIIGVRHLSWVTTVITEEGHGPWF